MIRRDFTNVVVASLSAYPFAPTAQRSIPIIGVLSPAVRPAKFSSSIYGAFSQGMRELGYVEVGAGAGGRRLPTSSSSTN
jgi:hypothetical protein